jgi:oligoribonuclease NrnB/cAMP/cGMP phosphodiesterase (DHH superfamily)
MSKSVSDPSNVNLVLYHDKCPDGFGAAFAAWKKLGDNAQYIGCDHGSSTVPDVHNKIVVILDFSFKRDILFSMIKSARQLLVIDHHDSAEKELKDIPDEYKIFDMTHSGAILAWNFFHPSILPPHILLYVEDRDLWTWKLKDAEEICAGLDTIPQTFQDWNQLGTDSIRLLKSKGESILAYKQVLVDSIVSKSTEKIIDGIICRVVNSSGGSIVSQVGDTMLKKFNVPLAVIWYIDYTTKQVKVSLRSIPGTDCSIIAKKYKGGGHKESSAFVIPLSSDSFGLLQMLFNM